MLLVPMLYFSLMARYEAPDSAIAQILSTCVFSTLDKLEESCAELGFKDYRIKHIDDGREFIESVMEGGVRIMLDPYRVTSENKTRWTEIILE